MENKLRNVLKANALFSLLSGTIMLLFGKTLAEWMNISNALVLTIIGIGLILFGVYVYYNSAKAKISVNEVKVIIIQDWIWVIGSLIIIMLQLFNINFQGFVLIGIIALVVADFAFFQNYFLKRMS